MNRSPAFQWYPKDILSSSRVAEMTLEEEGAYRRALDFCWINGSVPSDAERLARLIGKGASVLVATVVQPMFIIDVNDPSRMIHERLEIERKKQESWREKSIVGGKKSAKMRKQKELQTMKGGSKMVATNVQPNANSSSSSSSSFSKEKEDIQENFSVEKPKRKKKPLTGIPPDFSLTDAMRKWFTVTCPRLDIEKELDRFRDRCIAKGTEYADWEAGWRTQMKNAEDWLKEPAYTSEPAATPAYKPETPFVWFPLPDIPYAKEVPE